MVIAAGCVSTPPPLFRVENNRLMRGDKPLTEAFQAIESFDVSEKRGEIAFSAKRTDNFDIGLVSTDGSPISWVPSEPVDEIGVRWAPRGNKIGYIVRGRSGDFIRTVHVPTAAQVAVDFPHAKIEKLTWDFNGDRFTVRYSTPDASVRTEVMDYQGGGRKITTPPAQKLNVEVETLAAGAITLRPSDVRYGEKLPLVIWHDEELFGWNATRADLMRKLRVACVVTRRVDEKIWEAVDRVPWLDRDQTFVVAEPGTEFELIDAELITVQSSAARIIADRLKRNGPPNGSSR